MYQRVNGLYLLYTGRNIERSKLIAVSRSRGHVDSGLNDVYYEYTHDVHTVLHTTCENPCSLLCRYTHNI